MTRRLAGKVALIVDGGQLLPEGRDFSILPP
jgi:hypothetical protein